MKHLLIWAFLSVLLFEDVFTDGTAEEATFNTVIDCFENKAKKIDATTDWKHFLKPFFTLFENTDDETFASIDPKDDDNLVLSITQIIQRIQKKREYSTILAPISFQKEFWFRKEHHHFTDVHVKNVRHKLQDMQTKHFNLRQSTVTALRVAATTKKLYKLNYSTTVQLKQKFIDVEKWLDKYIKLRNIWAEFLMEYRTDIDSERKPLKQDDDEVHTIEHKGDDCEKLHQPQTAATSKESPELKLPIPPLKEVRDGEKPQHHEPQTAATAKEIPELQVPLLNKARDGERQQHHQSQTVEQKPESKKLQVGEESKKSRFSMSNWFGFKCKSDD